MRRVAVDNFATHAHPAVQSWLASRPRVAMHVAPTGASWLNMVERFFRDISQSRIKRDSFTSVAELEMAIDLYIAHYNARTKPSSGRPALRTSWVNVTRARAAPGGSREISTEQSGAAH